MQLTVYKWYILLLLLATPFIGKTQVFGGYFYVSYDRESYILQAFGIDNDSTENNKQIKLDNTNIHGCDYDTINFISFQNISRKPYPYFRQFYETILLRVNKKESCEEMLIIITGVFDDKLNYELNIEFNNGIYLIYIPDFNDGLLQKVKKSENIGASFKLSSLLTKMD
ncbi:MAG: hypothetical protein ACK4K0_09495 [Flavobacteriales bacterium]